MNSKWLCDEHGYFEDETGEHCPICDEQMYDTNNPIYADGAGWNGKISRMCVVVNNIPYVFTVDRQLTNNEAEYNALIIATQVAKNGTIIYSDSQVVVNQINNIYACNEPRLATMRDVLYQMIGTKKLKYVYIPRNNNLAGKHLEKTK